MIRRALPASLLLALGLAGCSDDKSFAVVSVLTESGQLKGVSQLQVNASDGAHQEVLLYPERAADPMVLDASVPVTFSLSFATSFSGTVDIEVEAIDVQQNPLGYGRLALALQVRQTVHSTVYLTPGAARPQGASPSPAGAGISASSTTLACQPTNPGATCGENRTCALRCSSGAAPTDMCFVAGQRQPGEACAGNQDCSAGSQCLEFSCSTEAQPVRTCLRFCTSDEACGQGSICDTAVPCGTATADFHVCSRPCDPSGDGTSGCAAGLVCRIFSGEHTNCACHDASAAGVTGAACHIDTDCQPGLMCVSISGATSCRPVCKLDSRICPTGTTCSTLGYKTYGACLPN